MHVCHVCNVIAPFLMCDIILSPDSTSAELGTLNEALQELLDGIQVNFMLQNTATLTLTPWWKEGEKNFFDEAK